MAEQMAPDDLRDDMDEVGGEGASEGPPSPARADRRPARYPRPAGATDTGQEGRARPAVSEAEVAPCECPELCLRDHENE